MSGASTPGKWVVNPLLRSQICTDEPSPKVLAVTAKFGCSAEEQIANGILMAAAPELLAALQDAEQALNKIRVCCHHTAWDATGPAVIAARAAIAKATGGAA